MKPQITLIRVQLAGVDSHGFQPPFNPFRNLFLFEVYSDVFTDDPLKKSLFFYGIWRLMRQYRKDI